VSAETENAEETLSVDDSSPEGIELSEQEETTKHASLDGADDVVESIDQISPADIELNNAFLADQNKPESALNDTTLSDETIQIEDNIAEAEAEA
ncbi:hypothetical protein, partial [Methylophaga sp. UBA2689]